MNKLSEKGFGLIQVMMAATVMSVLGLGIANMTMQSQKNMLRIEDKHSSLNLQNELMIDLSNPDFCTAAFLDTRIRPQTVMNALGSSNIRKGNNFDRLKIDNIRLTNHTVSTTAAGTGRMNLNIDLKERSNVSMKPVTIPLRVTTTGVGANLRILNCSATGAGGNGGGSEQANCCPVPNVPVTGGAGGMRRTVQRVPASDGSANGPGAVIHTTSGCTQNSYVCTQGQWALLGTQTNMDSSHPGACAWSGGESGQ